MTLRNRIQQILDANKWSQRELARHAGLAEAHVGQILRRLAENESGSASTETLRKIANAANVSIQWLLTGEDDEFDPKVFDSIHASLGDVPGVSSDFAALKKALESSPSKFEFANHDELIRASHHWLRVVHQLQARGRKVTIGAILAKLTADLMRLAHELRVDLREIAPRDDSNENLDAVRAAADTIDEADPMYIRNVRALESGGSCRFGPYSITVEAAEHGVVPIEVFDAYRGLISFDEFLKSVGSAGWREIAFVLTTTPVEEVFDEDEYETIEQIAAEFGEQQAEK